MELNVHSSVCMKTLILLSMLMLVAGVAQALPSKVILIRHGEEPLGDEGRELSDIGWERARGLVGLFEGQGITRLVALQPHKKKGSIRSIQTLEPISESLGLALEWPYTRDQVSDLVQMLVHDSKYDGQVVLVAWQHETLAEIAHGLGANRAPEKWGKVFDRYWVLEFSDGKVSSFQNLPQRLLTSDSAE